MALTNQYIIDLRAGKINLATALLKPQTTQTYSANNTINTKQFLTERGYDITKPESIPNSVFSPSSTKSAARVAAEERTLQLALQKQQQQKDETARLARINSMNSVSENSNNLPHYDAQNQRSNNNITNNNVNPSSLFSNQPVNVTGQSQNSSVNGGINVNANYNTAVDLNNYQSTNPNSSINHGLLVNPQYYTAGQSSVPYNNEVKTSQLGGDIQHQETDVNTNLEYEKLLSQQSQSNVNWAMPFSALSLPLVAVGGLAAYMLLRKKR